VRDPGHTRRLPRSAAAALTVELLSPLRGNGPLERRRRPLLLPLRSGYALLVHGHGHCAHCELLLEPPQLLPQLRTLCACRRELLLLAARSRARVAEGAQRGPHARVLEHALLLRSVAAR
jgi:hypothetical protein